MVASWDMKVSDTLDDSGAARHRPAGSLRPGGILVARALGTRGIRPPPVARIHAPFILLSISVQASRLRSCNRATRDRGGPAGEPMSRIALIERLSETAR